MSRISIPGFGFILGGTGEGMDDKVLIMSEKSQKESPRSPVPVEKQKEQAGLYQLDPKMHDVLKKYPAQFLAKGGEHLVYEIGSEESGDLRDVVIKGSVREAKRIQMSMDEHGARDVTELPAEMQEQIRFSMEEDAKKYRTLRQAFGSDHVAPQRKIIANVPMNEAMAEEVFGEGSEKREAWTVVTIQKLAKELKDPDAEAMDIGARYVVRRGVRPAGNAESFLDERSAVLLERAEQDPGLKEQIVDFIARAAAYTEQEHEILDFIGSRNVYFYKKKNTDGSHSWSYRILDGMVATPFQKDMDVAKVAIGRFEETGVIEDRGEANALLNAMAYARSINAVAEKLGLTQRINILGDVRMETLPGLLKEIQKRTGPEGMDVNII